MHTARPAPRLTSPLLANTELDRQIALEERAVQNGVVRYRKLAQEATERGDGAALKPAERLLVHWFGPLTHLINEELRAIHQGVPGKGRVIIGPVVSLLPAEDLAVIVMHEAVGACMKDPTGVRFVGIASSVGAAVFAELHMQQAAKERAEVRARADAGEIGREDAWREIRRLDLNTRFRAANTRRVNWWARKNLSESWKERSAQVHTGAMLLSKLIEAASSRDYMEHVHTPAFSHANAQIKGKTVGMLRMSRECHDLIDEGHVLRQAMRPRYLPMIVRPYKWTEDAQGGYVSIRTPLVSKITPLQRAAIDAADMSRTYDGLDAIAGVALRKQPVIEMVARHFWDQGGGVLGMPSRGERAVPPKPDGFDATIDPRAGATKAERKALREQSWAGVDPDERTRWRRAASEVHRQNVQRASARAEMEEMIGILDLFHMEQPLYYPHQLDHRGRAYPIPQHLNYQGDDLRRAMLEFSEGKDASDTEAMDHIRIDAANAWGHGKDKVTYAERVAWVRDMERDIRLSASDPLACDFWHGAEDPWQFLACCIALHDPERAAHIPVGRDGSSNGLQHYAALGRDAEGAALVNMVPNDRPADLYTRIAKETRSILAGRRDRIASMLVPLVDRSVVKQPVMTRGAYGSTLIGITRQVRNSLVAKGVEDAAIVEASKYLSGVILEAIGQTCVGASRLMEYFRRCAGLILATGEGVSWVNPVGFPVVLPHRNYTTRRVVTVVQAIDTLDPDTAVSPLARKQIDATPPGIIHSIDAAAMMMTAVACRDRDCSFVGVHDKYATHAATRGLQDRILREEHVRLHERPILLHMVAHWRDIHPSVDFPEPPEPGTYDIRTLIDCPYAFG